MKCYIHCSCLLSGALEFHDERYFVKEGETLSLKVVVDGGIATVAGGNAGI